MTRQEVESEAVKAEMTDGGLVTSSSEEHYSINHLFFHSVIINTTQITIAL